jgi:hypothetical protein
MMSFKQYLATQQLDEGLLRTAALVSWSSKSKADGDRAVSSFQAGKRILAAGTDKDTAEDIQKRTQSALVVLFDGLLALRQQIGFGVALDLSGHLLAAKAAAQINQRK